MFSFFRVTILLLISRAVIDDFQFLFTPLESIMISDILQFAGLSFILTGILKKLRVQPFTMLTLALLMQMAASWASALIEPTTMLSMGLGFFVFTGKTSGFPLLLWYVYPAAGMAFAGLLQGEADRGPLYRRILGISVAVLASLACCLIQTGYDLRKLYMLESESYYAQDLFHSLFALSLLLILLSLCYFAFRGVSGQTALMRFFRWCSANLNKIYVIQWLLIGYTLAAMVLLEMDLFTLNLVIPVGLVFVLAAMGLCVLWNRLRRRTGKA